MNPLLRLHPKPLLAILLLALAGLSGCSALDLLNAMIPSGSYVRTQDIAYGDLPRQKLDVYMPARADKASRLPTVLFIYGGRWSDGKRQDYLFAAEALAAQGWVTIVADYRLYPEVRFPVFVDDMATAVRWARDHAGEYGGDPDKLFLMGHSAGAHIAAMLGADPRFLQARGLSPRQVRGIIGLAGPYDFLPLKDPDLKDMFGNGPELPQTQPIQHITGQEPPMLLITGQDDATVNPGNTRRLAQKIREKGGRAEDLYYPGYDHIKIIRVLAAPFRRGEPLLEDVARFIARESASVSTQAPPAATPAVSASR